MRDLFETRPQKLIWLLFSGWMIFVWYLVGQHNGSVRCELLNKGCASVYPTLVTSLVVAIVLSLVFSKRKQ